MASVSALSAVEDIDSCRERIQRSRPDRDFEIACT